MTHPEARPATVRAAQRPTSSSSDFVTPVQLSDPRIRAIASVDSDEPLIDARDQLRFDRRLADRDGLYGCLRAPHWDEARSHVETNKFVAPPQVAPHQTGGAVDLTLCHDNGVELDLGPAVNASPEVSGDRCFTGSGQITARAHELRGELGRVLTSVGLVNDPTQWWHWSYGERYWAYTHGLDQTRYAPVTGALPRPRR